MLSHLGLEDSLSVVQSELCNYWLNNIQGLRPLLPEVHMPSICSREAYTPLAVIYCPGPLSLPLYSPKSVDQHPHWSSVLLVP